MQQLDRLWNYQKADMDVVRYETEMRQFPMRQKLLKLRNLVADQQTLVKGMENDAAAALAIAMCHARSATSLLRRKDPDVKETV